MHNITKQAINIWSLHDCLGSSTFRNASMVISSMTPYWETFKASLHCTTMWLGFGCIQNTTNCPTRSKWTPTFGRIESFPGYIISCIRIDHTSMCDSCKQMHDLIYAISVLLSRLLLAYVWKPRHMLFAVHPWEASFLNLCPKKWNLPYVQEIISRICLRRNTHK